MANLEDTVRSAAPGGSIAKPLLIALSLYWLRAHCFEEAAQALPRARGRHQHPTKGLGACSEDWVDCWTNYRRVAWATWSIPGLVPGKISRSHLNSLAQR